MELSKFIAVNKIHFTENYYDLKTVCFSNNKIYIRGGFGWNVDIFTCRYTLPFGFTVFGAIAFLLSYALYGEVLRENTYLSRTIEVQENQRVIDTGLYGIYV